MDEAASVTADEQRRAALDLEKRIGRWPRRLLHVPSMTSHHWQPGNRYGLVYSPQYNAISYTWGRFRETDQSLQVRTLDIKGISWSVPRIKTDHFDVEKLKTVIEECRENEEQNKEPIDYLWIDIACIDQSGSINSDLEIGRQAHIFQHAYRVYIWLGRTPKLRLEELHAFWCFWKTLRDDFSPKKYDQKALDEAQDVLTKLNEEPWFSSVWTLQEAYLRKDAVLLSASGKPEPVHEAHIADIEVVHRGGNGEFRLQHLLDACDAVWLLCWARTPDLQPEDIVYQLMNLGIVGLNRNDPMRLYATAMSRKPSKETDCIYGIQQIFNLRLGETNPCNESDSYTLEQLEDELGGELMRAHPVLSQNFVHTNSTLTIGKRWRLSRNIENPTMPFDYDTPWSHSIYQPRCKLSTRQAGDMVCGWFEGSVCDFAALQQAWTARHLNPSRFKPPKQPLVIIQLDVGSELFMRIPLWQLASTEPGTKADEAWNLETAKLLVAFTDPAVNPDCDSHGSLKVLRLGEHQSTEDGCHIGLMLFRSRHEPLDIWRRVGICAWLGQFSTSYGPAVDFPGYLGATSQQDVPEQMPFTSALEGVAPSTDVSESDRVFNAISCDSDAWSLLSGYFG